MAATYTSDELREIATDKNASIRSRTKARELLEARGEPLTDIWTTANETDRRLANRGDI